MTNTIVYGDGRVNSYSSGNLMKNTIPVYPGEVLHFHAGLYDSIHMFRFNYYDENGNYLSHGTSGGSDQDSVVPDGAWYIWLSYPNNTDTSVTVVTPYDTINAKITATATNPETTDTATTTA